MAWGQDSPIAEIKYRNQRKKKKENCALSSTSPSIKAPFINRIFARSPRGYLLGLRSLSGRHFGSARFGGGCFGLYSFIDVFIVGVLVVVGVTFSLPIGVLQREDKKQKISWQQPSPLLPALLDMMSCQRGHAVMQIHLKSVPSPRSSASVTPSLRARLRAALATAVI